MSVPQDLANKKFGRLTCIEKSTRNENKETTWLCKCDCGNYTEVSTSCLKKGNTRSCGCLKREMLIKRNTVHSLSKGQDGKKTRLYNIWVRMRQRCNDSNSSDYDRYGGRGIEVCAEWSDFRNFHSWANQNGYTDFLTIEREDLERGYEPSNCKWITPDKQARNKRNNHFISFNGERKTLAEWSEITGIESSTLRQRLNLGWSEEKTLTEPVRRKKR